MMHKVALWLFDTYSSERLQPLQQRRVVAPNCALGECPIALGVGLTLIRHAARLQGNATTLSGTVTS